MHFPITHYEYVSKAYDKSITTMVDDMMRGKPNDFMVFGDSLLQLEDASWFLDDSLAEVNLRLAVRVAYHMWRMRNCGEQIYYVPPHLCEMFLHTTLSLDAEFIQSPYEEIYVYTDQDEMTISDKTGTLPIKGLYINLGTDLQGERMLRFVATSGVKGIEEEKDVNYFACFRIPEHGTIDEIIETQFKEYMSDTRSVELMKDDMVDLDKLADILRFAINILMYITSENADLQSVTPKRHDKKSPKKQKKYRNKAQMSFVYVGKGVPHPKGSNGIPSGTRISHKFWVRGHWRAQWFGSSKDNDQHQKKIWIKPYIKGKDFAEDISKRYIVQ
jgi:hypothetical protein